MQLDSATPRSTDAIPLDFLPADQRDAVVEPIRHLACQLGARVFGTQHVAETTAQLTRALSDSPTPFVIEAIRLHQANGITYSARVFAGVSHLRNLQDEPIATLGTRATLELTYDNGRTQAHVRVGEFRTYDLVGRLSEHVVEAIDHARAKFSAIEGVLRTGEALEAISHNIRGDQPRPR